MFQLFFAFQGDGQSSYLKQAYQELPEACALETEAVFFDTGMIDSDPVYRQKSMEKLKTADFIYLDVHGGLPYFKSFELFFNEFSGRIPSFVHSGIDDENVEMQKISLLSPVIYSEIVQYQNAGGMENCRNLLLYLLKSLGNIPCEPLPVQIPKWDGIYLPEGEDEDAYLSHVKCVSTCKSQIIIGILIPFHNIQNGNLKHIDALIQAVKEAGAVPLPMYTNIMPTADYEGLRGALKRYMMMGNEAIPDVLIVTGGHSLSVLSAPGDGSVQAFDPFCSQENASVFEMLDVPVLQAMTTYFTYEQWVDSPAGMDSMLLCSNVYQTEFDGQLISVPIAYTDMIQTPFGSKSVTLPIADRVEKAVRLAYNWGKLRHTPMEEKKVAVIFHNMPPRVDMIGCAYGLDTPESVYQMYLLLKERGLHLDYEFDSGKAILDKIIAGVTNDGRFLSEEQLLERSTDLIQKEDYTPWFDCFPAKVKRELERDWGKAPGEFMTIQGKILIPGIKNGNLFIGLQPPRALEEHAEQAYHSTDMVCPYQYLAFYRYVEKIFGADVIVHVGTHGTIEWLPGKEIGLSQECYPDLAIGDLPHLYPYIIDVPGEGVQAKRRTAAAVLDHLIPSMTEAGVYGSLARIDEQMTQYYDAKTNDPGKQQVLLKEIWKTAKEMHLDQDLDLTEREYLQAPESAIERMHLWISDIKSAKIKDGLHIFGNVPREERYINMLRSLVFLRNDEIPSLREGICAYQGEDLEELLSMPGQVRNDGRTNRMMLEETDELGRRIFAKIFKDGMDEVSIHSIRERINEILCTDNISAKGDDSLLMKCLHFAAGELRQRLNKVTDELEYFERGISGRFISPGPSGAPTRGNARLLPTGRNFYTIDPTAVPNRASWETGKRLGDQLIQRFLAEEGKYPEETAIIVYSGETMKTHGDDVAEIMYLYGVRPVWLQSTDRVIGLEVIPAEELGRPRIDVTLRISGLFRDTFPNLIERIEDAVNLVAALDESEDINYVKKHVMTDFRHFLSEGMDRERAFEMAGVRIFGCPPGGYGAGVDILVNSKKWEKTEDLGEAYLTWSGHAYGKKLHGEKFQEILSRRMSRCDLTVKNVSSFESDMLDSDDFYNYHGGLISAVKAAKGSFPVSYTTNAGDPRHVETRSIHEETSRIMRARINNPRWIEGLKKHGFKGAQEFSAMLDIVFGWDATSSVVDDWMYESVAETYLLDGELRAWIQDVNPWALHSMSERLLEAEQRGMWEAKEETLEAIKEIFLETEGDLEDM